MPRLEIFNNLRSKTAQTVEKRVKWIKKHWKHLIYAAIGTIGTLTLKTEIVRAQGVWTPLTEFSGFCLAKPITTNCSYTLSPPGQRSDGLYTDEQRDWLIGIWGQRAWCFPETVFMASQLFTWPKPQGPTLPTPQKLPTMPTWY